MKTGKLRPLIVIQTRHLVGSVMAALGERYGLGPDAFLRLTFEEFMAIVADAKAN